jgi:NADH:ubiquinone oxidoreductase subunit 4 (subunit M)
MSSLGYVLAAVFLPLFPFSILFNQLLARLANARLRMIVLLLWPQIGVLALLGLVEGPPGWMIWWAVATAILYALRSVVLRDLGLWIGYMATSAWALLWPAAAFAYSSEGGGALALHAIALSLPFILLAWLTDRLESELGAAYAGVCGGLAETLPRLSGLLALAVLAAVATPVVPGFFTLLSITVHALPVMPGVVVLILTVWLLWAWSGVRILRGFIVGPACGEPKRDLGSTATGLLGLAFVVLVLAGIGFSGELV